MYTLFSLNQICGFVFLALAFLIQPQLASSFPRQQSFYLCAVPSAGLAATLNRLLHLASPFWLNLFKALFLALWLVGLILVLNLNAGATRLIALALAVPAVTLLAVGYALPRPQLQRAGLMVLGFSLLFNAFHLRGLTVSSSGTLTTLSGVAAVLALVGFVFNVISSAPNSKISVALQRRLPQLAPYSCDLMLGGAVAMLVLGLLQLLTLPFH